ncbi:deaminase [Streptomyces sp. 3MP-14]|uniref:Deaminase n=1 Tax=Streptomyces mimosae TaxID=2586635 RepID=A0A5N6A8F7_9ACTN|nr:MULTISPECIES: dihydrofolate reductase family protein [Streptomyces]KAB8164219.1 deaminase [Streptomyces mimosae]KAB8176496.1 deaminase [Streptomyces sp. 3MP-14]
MAGRLVYTAIASLDGYLTDEQGSYDWSAPDEEVHAFVNALERTVGTQLLGRRTYGEMTYWDTAGHEPEQSAASREFAELWRASDKVVFSRTLDGVSAPRTRLEREFDPAAVREWKAAATADLAIGGPTLAALALAAGLVDECRLFLNPTTVGAGLPAFPRAPRLSLTLREERRFAGGVVYLRYGVNDVSSEGR